MTAAVINFVFTVSVESEMQDDLWMYLNCSRVALGVDLEDIIIEHDTDTLAWLRIFLREADMEKRLRFRDMVDAWRHGWLTGRASK
jgi:hypothetical protein